MSAREGRTIAELVNDSYGMAREALLDMSADRAPGMVRGWPRLIQSAAQLWPVLPPDPTISAGGDPIAILAAMGRAVGRSLAAAGHWPRRGPRDEAWEHIASNFGQARRLLQEQPVASEAVSTDDQIGPAAKTQILHTLHVAAHATAVALTGYQRDLQHRLDVVTRRRQPFVERPNALEVESSRRHDCPIRRHRAARSRTGRLGDPGPPDTRQPPGPGRPGTGRPRAGAHRHHNRRRQRSCGAARRDRRRREPQAHPGIRECSAGLEPLSTPLGRSSPRRPAGPIRPWLRRPVSFGPP